MFFVIKKIFQQSLNQGTFINNVATLLSGNIIAQIITLTAAPIITRLYSPDDFGITVYLISLVNILTLINTLRYENAIVLPQKEQEAIQLFILCTLLSICISLLLALIINLFGDTISNNLLHKSWLKDWLWIVPIWIFIISYSRILTFIHTRYKSFKTLSLSRIATSITGAGIKITLGCFIGSSATWLITGNILSLIISIIILGYSFFFHLSYQLNWKETLKNLKSIAIKYSKFPRYFLPTGILNTTSQNLPVLLLAYLFPQDVLGYYGLAITILKRPISIMGESFGKVFFQKAAENRNTEKALKNLFIKGTIGLAALGIIPFLILSLKGKWIFSILFGYKWQEAGLYVQILAPWLFFLFINTPATQIIISKQALEFNFKFNLISMIIRSLSIIISFYLLSTIFWVLIFFSISGVLLNLFYIYYAYSLTTSHA